MVFQDALLVTLVQLVDHLPLPAAASKRRRGHPAVYSDRLFLKALVSMIVRHLHKVNELLSVLAQPTAEMAILRGLLSENGRFPSRRTWERRLKSLPATLPAQIGCLGRHLIALIQPWATCGRAVAIESTVLRAHGGVWHQKHREQGERPHTSIDPEAHWAKSGWQLSSMAGNCTSSRWWLGSGSPSPPCSRPPMSLTVSLRLLCWPKSRLRCASC